MKSNLLLLFSALFGILLGTVLKKETKATSTLMFGVLFIMMFVMGAKLGAAPDLAKRLITYGKSSVVITFFVLLFSVVITYLIIKLYGKIKK